MELTVEQALWQGVAAHKEGKREQAERLYRAILRSQPLHPDANHNLGVLAVSFNKAGAALSLFKTALEANPTIEQFWFSYIDALIKEKLFDNAKLVLEQAKVQGVSGDKLIVLETQLAQTELVNEPDSAALNKELLLLQTQTKLSEPKKANKRNIKAKFPSQQQLNSLLVHYQKGRLHDAEKLAVHITCEYPRNQFAWKVLGAVLEATGRKSEAADAKQTVVALSPKDAGAHYNLGNTLQEIGRLNEALASYKRAITLNPDFAEAHNNLGNTLQKLFRLDEAVASYNQAIDLNLNFFQAYSNLGSTLKALGRMNEAKANYTRAIELNPDFAHAHRMLTSLKKFVTKDDQYLKMLELYLDEKISEEQRCHINFGLAKACEDLEDFEQAYNHYRQGNALRKKHLKYDISQDIELFRQLKSSYPEITKSSPEPDKLSKNLMPIFIVGMPRSGTTLIEQIISSHSRVKAAGELNYAKQFGAAIATGITEINTESLLEFRHAYLDKLQNVSGGKFIVTDKMPQNFRYLGLLATAFPEAKIVHVRREPAAVCWANYKQYFQSENIGYCYSIDDVIRYYKLYENLMDFWINTLNKRIYNLDYEKLTVNQEIETRQLIDHLGLEWDEGCLSPQNNTRSVLTASNFQVRQKVYQGSSMQWRKYAPFLDGAFDSLLSS